MKFFILLEGGHQNPLSRGAVATLATPLIRQSPILGKKYYFCR